MPDTLGLSKKERKILIEKMRDMKQFEREVSLKEEKFIQRIIPTYTCPRCGTEVHDLTTDHRIPKWIFNPTNLIHLGIKDKYKYWDIVSSTNKRFICSPCNSKKGGSMDYTDPFVREFARNVIKQFENGLARTSISVRIHVQCRCKETL